MIGIPFNPDNCAFIANQALNTNQFNGSVPNAANESTHTVLWDFIEEKLYWVNTKTNIIERELPGSNVCDFYADINYMGITEGGYQYSCIPVNGTAPFTYSWSVESGPGSYVSISGSSTNQIVLVAPNINIPAIISIIKCVVTDAEGCKTSASFMTYINNQLLKKEGEKI